MLGAVATGDGRISIVDLQACVGKACQPQELHHRLALGSYFITAVRFIDRQTLAVGVIQAVVAGHSRRFHGAAVVVLNTTGVPIFQRSIALARDGNLESFARCRIWQSGVRGLHAEIRLVCQGGALTMPGGQPSGCRRAIGWLAGVVVAGISTLLIYEASQNWVTQGTWPVEQMHFDHPIGNTFGELIEFKTRIPPNQEFRALPEAARRPRCSLRHRAAILARRGP